MEKYNVIIITVIIVCISVIGFIMYALHHDVSIINSNYEEFVIDRLSSQSCDEYKDMFFYKLYLHNKDLIFKSETYKIITEQIEKKIKDCSQNIQSKNNLGDVD